LGYAKDHFTLSAGVFGESVSSSPEFTGYVGEENVTFSARATVAPINREVNGVNQVLHFGASGRWRDVGDDQPFLQYAAPGTNLALANVFNTTSRIGNSDTFWGLEAAGVWGPLAVQGEYGETSVDLPGGALIRNPSTGSAQGTPPYFSSNVRPAAVVANPFLGVRDPSYYGWYADASYFLTGETRPYKDGVFGRVKVKNPVQWSKDGGMKGWGAWQIAGRYDFLSLSDSAFNNVFTGVNNYTGGCANTRLANNALTNPTGTSSTSNPARLAQCGEQETWIVGLNWYLTDYTRIMFNYMQTELSNYPTTVVAANTSGIPAGSLVTGFDGATIRGFGTRVQFDW
jgi:phosphate-selective porin OprO/OprP